ncbi:MAG: hypothetical protein ABWZ40_13380, partial [Caulobacterales bacterium]
MDREIVVQRSSARRSEKKRPGEGMRAGGRFTRTAIAATLVYIAIFMTIIVLRANSELNQARARAMSGATAAAQETAASLNTVVARADGALRAAAQLEANGASADAALNGAIERATGIQSVILSNGRSASGGPVLDPNLVRALAAAKDGAPVFGGVREPNGKRQDVIALHRKLSRNRIAVALIAPAPILAPLAAHGRVYIADPKALDADLGLHNTATQANARMMSLKDGERNIVAAAPLASQQLAVALHLPAADLAYNERRTVGVYTMLLAGTGLAGLVLCGVFFAQGSRMRRTEE